MAKEYKVRVHITNEQRENWGQLIEWLRYAGLLGIIDNAITGDVLSFSIVCPRHIPKCNSESWAKANSQRIRSFASGAHVEIVEVK